MKRFLQPKQQFEESLQYLARSMGIRSVFEDFLDYSLLMMRWWDLTKAHFSDLEKKYPEKRQHELFARAYFAMTNIAEHDGSGFKDPFGDFYMEYISNDHNGQFFTPEPVCELMAKLQIGPELPDNATVADPCCGSGRLLLAAAKVNRKALFYAADVDLVCCKMTVLNFMMNTLCGEVAWMNSISMQHWKSWQVKKVLDGNAMYVPYYIETGRHETQFIIPDKESAESAKHDESDSSRVRTEIPKPVKEKIIKKWKKNDSNQLTLVFE